jgi:tetratricopeptide (TPR) repeat protein
MRKSSPVLAWIVPLLAIVLIALGSLAYTPAAQAQGNDWRERPTAHFVILYTPGSEATAEQYAGFVDTIYEEAATVFSHRVAVPITLRLYPTRESYYQVNPMARNVPGVVAHADFQRRELVVIIEQTQVQNPDEIPNNIRHELTHIVVADLSANRVNTGFHEGMAQYIEHSSREILQQKAQLLNQARNQGRLLVWSDFDDRDRVYSAPEVSYPQALSVVAFLIEQHGFGAFRNFLTISASSSGYRSALERAYGIAPADLEEQWRDWLPSYLEGGYVHNVLTSYDLAYPSNLIAQGRYAEAQAELEQAVEWLRQNANVQPPEILATAEQLLARSQEGQRADTLAIAARTALEQADYERARQLVAQARDSYSSLGDTRQDAVLDIYAQQVARGLSADQQLAQSIDLIHTFRFPQARAAIDASAAEFAALGAQEKLDRTLALRSLLDERQRWAGLVILSLGALGLIASLWSGLSRRSREVW